MSLKIQVVENDDVVRPMLVRVFESAGFEVVEAGDGIHALEVFHLETPDLLITDVNIPGINGYELCRRVRAVSSVPIILIADYAFSEEDEAEAISMGVNAVLSKPFDICELNMQIDGLLTESRTIHGC